MTKPANRYSWQPLRALHANQERLEQDRLKDTQADLESAQAVLARATEAHNHWLARRAYARRELENSLLVNCGGAELQNRSAFDARCVAMCHKQYERRLNAERKVLSMTRRVEQASLNLHGAHAQRKASDMHYEKWLVQQRRDVAINEELEQEDQYAARSFTRYTHGTKPGRE
ncbi:MAG: hypothetical protein H6714_00945 [Myxococcales bacterium]|nr:hypothetical protein [Myxococcales bacterium]